MREAIERCSPCLHGPTGEARHHGCESSDLCIYPEEHHVHHGIGTMMFDPHPFHHRFPIQGCAAAKLGRDPAHAGHPDGSVPWWLGVNAWARYAVRNGNGQSAARIAERGGFGHEEMDRLLGPEWREHFTAGKKHAA